MKSLIEAIVGRFLFWWLMRGLGVKERNNLAVLVARRLNNGHVSKGYELDAIRNDIKKAKEIAAGGK